MGVKTSRFKGDALVLQREADSLLQLLKWLRELNPKPDHCRAELADTSETYSERLQRQLFDGPANRIADSVGLFAEKQQGQMKLLYRQ
ncbi:hypothetical protein SAMN03080615_01240 [Amphritea atlantica]|uniref:Uncharacterized protein n=1 Tax=Amphritea atlantica TaxID=355243 RepID=A0A1H9FFV6_9GAMM|nr:hypothetical protein SAMN03080615_01240 [Amphritea atlantica]